MLKELKEFMDSQPGIKASIYEDTSLPIHENKMMPKSALTIVKGDTMKKKVEIGNNLLAGAEWDAARSHAMVGYLASHHLGITEGGRHVGSDMKWVLDKLDEVKGRTMTTQTCNTICRIADEMSTYAKHRKLPELERAMEALVLLFPETIDEDVV